MSDGVRKRAVAAPDGDPKPRVPDGDSSARSRVSEVQDPQITGDSGAERKRIATGDVVVDEAGQLTPKAEDNDLLH
jgi:hypothetical protein